MNSKFVAIAALAFLFCQTSFAQKVHREAQIVAGEYFIGVDPGIGKGMPISLSSPSTEVEAIIRNLPLKASQAVHVRFKNAKGGWTAPASLVYNGIGVNREALIAYAEYFIGADPGLGKGTPVTVSPATTLDLNVNSLALKNGQKLHLRIKDSENRWGAPVSWLYTGVGANRAVSINYAEYFIGADPGRSKGTKIAITSSTNSSLSLLAVSLLKNDKLRLRIRDEEKRWSDPISLSYPSRFVRNAEIVVGKKPNNTPVGSGTPMNPTDGLWGSAYEAIQGTLSNWNFRDSVWVRAQSSEHVWSIPVGDSVAYYPAPTLAKINPTIGNRLQTLNVVLNGSNFIIGVSGVSFGAEVTVKSVTVNSATKITANITIGANATTGARNVVLTNLAPGGGAVTLTNGFTVNNPMPTLSNLAPTGGNRSQTLDVALNGSNFISGISRVSFGTAITINSITVNSAAKITANITIGANAAIGARNVVITNAAPGGGTSTLTNGFTVNNPVPTLTKINPSSAKRGQTISVGFKGTNFIDKASSLNVGTNITVNGVAFHKADSLTAHLTIGRNAAPGPRNFAITNSAPGGGTSGNLVFTIINNEPAPPRLLAPANKDVIKLVTPAKPLKFVWRKSADADMQDTLKYSFNLKGPGLDTTVAGIKDTSVTLKIMPRLKVASTYNWMVKVSDGFVTVSSSEIFSLRTSDKLTGIDDYFSETPKAYRLEQNHPNPFNPSTRIQFELPKNEKVSLKIYDMLGHEVAVLVDEEKTAGKYEVTWEPIGESSGTYLYRLQAGAFVQVKKMILSR